MAEVGYIGEEFWTAVKEKRMLSTNRDTLNSIVEGIKTLNHHIECLQNDTEYVDSGDYISDLDREAYSDELIRDRELWVDDLKAFRVRGIQPSKPWPRALAHTPADRLG